MVSSCCTVVVHNKVYIVQASHAVIKTVNLQVYLRDEPLINTLPPESLQVVNTLWVTGSTSLYEA